MFHLLSGICSALGDGVDCRLLTLPGDFLTDLEGVLTDEVLLELSPVASVVPKFYSIITLSYNK